MLDTIKIRLARLEDVERLWSWRNDPNTRRSSHNTEAISFEYYTRWFKSVFSRKSCIFLIAELDSVAIGTVRFDKRRDSYLEVSMSIAPQARSKKLGAVCLRESCNFVLRRGAVGFHAEIRMENAASIRVFRRCGFSHVGRRGEFFLFRLEPDQ